MHLRRSVLNSQIRLIQSSAKFSLKDELAKLRSSTIDRLTVTPKNMFEREILARGSFFMENSNRKGFEPSSLSESLIHPPPFSRSFFVIFGGLTGLLTGISFMTDSNMFHERIHLYQSRIASLGALFFMGSDVAYCIGARAAPWGHRPHHQAGLLSLAYIKICLVANYLIGDATEQQGYFHPVLFGHAFWLYMLSGALPQWVVLWRSIWVSYMSVSYLLTQRNAETCEKLFKMVKTRFQACQDFSACMPLNKRLAQAVDYNVDNRPYVAIKQLKQILVGVEKLSKAFQQQSAGTNADWLNWLNEERVRCGVDPKPGPLDVSEIISKDAAFFELLDQDIQEVGRFLDEKEQELLKHFMSLSLLKISLSSITKPRSLTLSSFAKYKASLNPDNPTSVSALNSCISSCADLQEYCELNIGSIRQILKRHRKNVLESAKCDPDFSGYHVLQTDFLDTMTKTLRVIQSSLMEN